MHLAALATSYNTPLLSAAGWLGRDAILMAGINAIIYLLSTLPTWVVTMSASQPIDNYGIDGTS
jgi:hypothetical protein